MRGRICTDVPILQKEKPAALAGEKFDLVKAWSHTQVHIDICSCGFKWVGHDVRMEGGQLKVLKENKQMTPNQQAMGYNGTKPTSVQKL